MNMTFTLLGRLFMLSLVVVLSACNSHNIAPVATFENTKMAKSEYALAPGDTIHINVFRDPDLSGSYKLDGNGNITMPLLGTISAKNATLPLLEEDITNKLAGGFLVDPNVSISIESYSPFFISGEVKSPGSYDYSVSLNAFKAIALAGGLTPRARGNDYIIMRDTSQGVKYYKATNETPVFPGDSIMVEERLF